MGLANFINLIKKDLYTDKNENSYYNFLYSSMLNYAISLEIASSNNLYQPLTFEKICKIIPKKFGCRSSIKNALDYGVYEGFYIKETSYKDKRVKSYRLSEEYSLMITEWYLSRKESYAN
tara:strand:+ start:13 stop:372 length:360 start_codon:yes stop_codon:yes gene_type:complete